MRLEELAKAFVKELPLLLVWIELSQIKRDLLSSARDVLDGHQFLSHMSAFAACIHAPA
jgi:hypothetical protein